MEYLNSIKVLGKIVSQKPQKDGKIMITVVTNNGKETYIRFLCDASKLNEAIGDKSKQRVSITGHATQSTIAYTINNQRHKVPSQTFIVDEIAAMKTLTEDAFGVKGKFFENYFVRVTLKGQITDIRKDNNWTRYTIDVGENTPNYLRLSMKNIDRMPELEKGDVAGVVGNVTSPIRNYGDNKKVYFEDILILDIAKCS